MTQQPTTHPDHHGLHAVLSAIAQWIEKYRYACGARNELRQYTPEQIADIAHELGIAPSDLVALARKGPHAADLLNRLLTALGVDPGKLTQSDPLVMRDLQRLCINCSHKPECELDLESGDSAAHFRDYCPNAFTIDALLRAKQ